MRMRMRIKIKSTYVDAQDGNQTPTAVESRKTQDPPGPSTTTPRAL
jgi:hypothetical protein